MILSSTQLNDRDLQTRVSRDLFVSSHKLEKERPTGQYSRGKLTKSPSLLIVNKSVTSPMDSRVIESNFQKKRGNWLSHDISFREKQFYHCRGADVGRNLLRLKLLATRSWLGNDITTPAHQDPCNAESRGDVANLDQPLCAT